MTLREAFRIGRAVRAALLEEWPEDELSEGFDNYSQYTPWEFTAKAFNDSRFPDSTWTEFERGLYTAGRAELNAVKNWTPPTRSTP